MPRKKTHEPLSTGTPKKFIDWDKVDIGLMSQCPATEIAGQLGISVDTLYNRCIDDKGVTFSAYRQEKAQKGLALLRQKQFQKAMSGSGHSEMLKLLGAELLGQGQKKMSGDLQNLSDFSAAQKEGRLDDLMRQPDGV